MVIRASEVKYLNKEIENICNIESTHQNIHEYIALDISFNLCNLRSLKMQHLASLMHCDKYKCRKTLLPFIVGNKILRECEIFFVTLLHRKIYAKIK